MRLLIAIILSFFVLTNIVNAQSWPADSFNVYHSVDFEDNTIGLYSSHPAEIIADWGTVIGSDFESIEIEQHGATKVHRFNYPYGTVNGVNQGGDYSVIIFEDNADTIIDLYLSYDMMWKPGFEFVISGKTGGHMIVGDDWSGEHGGGPYFDEGGRFGLSWMDEDWLGTANLRFYFYHHDFALPAGGETKAWSDPYDDYGYFYFYTPDEIWYNMTIRMVLNSVSDSGNYDGFAEGFINGRWVTRWDSVRMRQVDTIGIGELEIYSQFGGSDPMFAAIRDEWLLTDNYYIWNYDWGVESVPHNYEHSDSSRVLHLPTTWTNATLSYTDSLPVINNLSGQTINAGETFSSIHLDNYVTDPDDLDADLTWSYSGNSNITVDITARVATLTYSGWTGSEIIKFKVADTWGNADSVYATFIVQPTTLGRTDQQILINMAYDPEQVPSTVVEGNYWNHMTWDEQVQDSIFDLYNTEGDNSDFDFTLLTSGAVVSNGVAGYRGTDYPDTCEYTYWLVASTYADIELDGFEIGELYNVKTYSSYIGGDGGNTTVTFLDTAKVVTAQNNATILSWLWTADAITETLRFSGEYGFLNFIEINQYVSIGDYFNINGRNRFAIKDEEYFFKIYH